MVDTLGLEPSALTGVRVRVSPGPPIWNLETDKAKARYGRVKLLSVPGVSKPRWVASGLDCGFGNKELST